MCLFSIVILGLTISWGINLVINDGLFTLNFGSEQIFFGKWNIFLNSTKGVNSNSQTFRYYITIFAFMLIWSGAGVAFEIIKNIFGGNKRI